GRVLRWAGPVPGWPDAHQLRRLTVSTCGAPGCGRPAQDVLCDGCTTDLAERLEQIDSDGYDHNHQPRPGLYQHLQITYARQDAISAGVRTRKTKGSSQPLPFKEKAAEVLDDLENTVRSEEHTSELQSRENLVCRLL